MRKHLPDGTVIEGTAEEILEYERLKMPTRTTTGTGRLTDINYDHLLKEVAQEGPTGCTHMGCPLCKGSGVKLDGTGCIHFVACYCPTCASSCLAL